MSGGMIKGGGRAIMSRESQRALIDLLIALEGVETATATSGGGGRRRLAIDLAVAVAVDVAARRGTCAEEVRQITDPSLRGACQ